MLIATANWAFSDGTLVVASRPRRVTRAWLRRVRLATIRSGFGRDGVYRPPAALDVVLAGDTLDCLVSAAWSGRERPWHAGNRAHALRRAVLIRCARRASPLFAGLAALVRRGLAAPAPDRRGRPSATATMRVPVRVALLAGDRDRQITDLAAEVAARGAVVAQAWCDGAVLVRHGHEFDPACHVAEAATGDRSPTLDESVAVDLVARFAASLRAAGMPMRGAVPLVQALAGAGLADIPALVAAWVAADGGAVEIDTVLRRGVVTAWHRAIDEWAREARRMPPDCGLPASPIEELAAWFAMEGAGVPPPALADLFDRSMPVAAGVDGRPETVVLGHPVQPIGAAAVICLGRPVVRPWKLTTVVRADGAADAVCVAAGAAAAEPATVAVSRSGGTTTWRRIAGSDVVTDEAGRRAALVVEAA